jgi:hypothetical protein
MHKTIISKAKEKGISITRLHDGSLELATIHGGQRVHQRYFGYAEWEAVLEFETFLNKKV